MLAECVSIKNIVKIFETLLDYGEKFSHNHVFLIEKVRQRLMRQICLQYVDKENTLQVLTLERDPEEKVIECGVETSDGMVSCLEPADHKLWIRELRLFQKLKFWNSLNCRKTSAKWNRRVFLRLFKSAGSISRGSVSYTSCTAFSSSR
ncbi:MAG: flagellar biosynthesis protein FlhA [Treponema sp.]|nr:flagellar biosynthesis protein FlhA [Treponema sp.]